MDNGLPAVGRFSTEWVELFILFGAIALVVLLAFFWAIFFRKSGKRRRIHRHRRHCSLNPTLAESGGLPPVREEEKKSGQTPP